MIFIGADHAGFELKEKLKTHLLSLGQKVEDYDTNSSDSCDYPLYAQLVAEKVRDNAKALGLLICGSGIGVAIAANKIHGIRAATVSEEKSAGLARTHNDCQVLCLGSRIIDFDKAKLCVDAFLNAKFEADHPRHQRRIDLMAKIEREECKTK